MFICKHCKKEFDGFSVSQKANHTRWCSENPKRRQYENDLSRMRDGITEESKKKIIDGIKQAHASGKYAGVAQKSYDTKKRNGTHLHTDESKELLRQKALASKHRRLVRSVREYVRLDGSTVMLDSSWEEALAKRLDDTGVEWIRPEVPIEYVGIDGRIHNYFPDFYLPKHNLYLDPKNPAAVSAQKDKLDILSKMMDNLVIIETLSECEHFVVGQL